MKKIEINMFEAGNGDCFLIKCLGDTTTNILIDFGYSSTYKKFVEKNLRAMAGKGELLDLVIITHIDQDHISGGIRFFEDNGHSIEPSIIQVNEVWHNSYRHLSMAETNTLMTDKEKIIIEQKSMFVERDQTGKVSETSGKQGSRLAANLMQYEYNWNKLFHGEAVSQNYEAHTLNDEVSITTLSPTTENLNELKKVWKRELKSKFPTISLNNEAIFDDAIECISLMRRSATKVFKKDTSHLNNIELLAKKAFEDDTDIINASSITVIIEFEGKKLLFLGDVTPSTIIKQLKEKYRETEFPIVFDAIKVSHHGSARNTNSELLNMIDSEHYFISTNGKIHRHPDVETLAKIVTRKNKEAKRNIYLTNRIEKLELFDNKDLQKKYRYNIHYRDLSKDKLQIYI